MDVDARHRARARARARSTSSRTRTPPGMRNEKRYAGHRGGARGGHRRHLDGQHPAPREPQRRDLRADRGPRARDVPRPDPRRGRRGRARRPRARGAPGAAASGQGLPEGAGRQVALDNFFRARQPRRAARARAARGRRGRRGAAHDAGRSSRSASRRSPSACSRSSSRSRSRSASCGARGARRSGSARRWTRSGCAGPGRQPTEEEAVSARRAAAARGHPRRALPRGRGRRPRRRPSRRVAAERGSTYIFVGTPDESRRREIFGGSLLSPLVRELPGLDIRVVADRADRDELGASDRRCHRARRARRRARRRRSSSRSGVRLRRAARRRRRILVPFTGGALDPTVLDAAIRIARAEDATLVPAYLIARPARATPRTRRCSEQVAVAMPLLEAVEHAALRAGVPVDARIEKGRTPDARAAAPVGGGALRPDRRPGAERRSGGFTAKDLTWILTHAPAETIVLKPSPNGGANGVAARCLGGLAESRSSSACAGGTAWFSPTLLVRFPA